MKSGLEVPLVGETLHTEAPELYSFYKRNLIFTILGIFGPVFILVFLFVFSDNRAEGTLTGLTLIPNLIFAFANFEFLQRTARERRSNPQFCYSTAVLLYLLMVISFWTINWRNKASSY
jgi:hypothetical protein